MAETVKKGARITQTGRDKVVDDDGSPDYLAAGAEPPPVESAGDAPPAAKSA
jgi:hypothetical protein